MSKFKPLRDMSKLSLTELSSNNLLVHSNYEQDDISIQQIVMPLLSKKSNLTNATHYAMKKNHDLLRSQIVEQPHHYFPVNHHKIREAIRRQERSLQASADKFVQPKDQKHLGTWNVEKEINKFPDLMIPTRQRKVMPPSTTMLRPRTRTRG